MYTQYDWVDPSSTRTPREYPYSFSSHYLWREKSIEGASPVWTDRMRQQDPELAERVFKDVGQFCNYTKSQCKRIIEEFFDGKAKCVGYALSCNMSTGYPIGIFFIRWIK